jgi:DHA2 family multidrug resistance protein
MAMMPMIGRAMYAGTNPKLLILIGLVSLEVCMAMITGFSPQTSHWSLLMMLFVRGFGMAFLFVPINSSILSQYKGQDLGQVSGLLNLFRQIGGSMGIALIATLMSTRLQQNYTDLLPYVSQLTHSGQQAFYQSMGGMSAKMSRSLGFALENRGTILSLFYRVMNQAFMMTFLQIMYLIMAIFGLSLIPLYLLKYKKDSKPVVVDAH